MMPIADKKALKHTKGLRQQKANVNRKFVDKLCNPGLRGNPYYMCHGQLQFDVWEWVGFNS